MGGIGKPQVGDHHNQLGMLEETIRQPRQTLADVFDRDFLRHHEPGDIDEPAVQTPHHVGQQRPVSHTGVEDAQARLADVKRLSRRSHPVGDHGLLVGGIDEHVVGRPGIKEAGHQASGTIV